MNKVRAINVKVGDLIQAPGLNKYPPFVVKKILHTTRGNTIFTESNGREWKVRSEQWMRFP